MWTQETEAKLHEMWTSGCSLNECATELCTTRGAISSKTYRMGLRRGEGFKTVRIAPKKQFWSEELLSSLKRLWMLGIRTQEISETIGVGRTAILTKAKELDLPKRGQVHIRQPREEYRPAPVLLKGTEKPWVERKFGECAYPVAGEGADTLSCCAPTEGTYCAAHRAIMYLPTKPIKSIRQVGFARRAR